ncbi:hypothetical protein A3F07_03715 [candidate division WWE3 bacterium RIFCSPHIGHO2_12_FULL_38_15]|uniref:Glycosyltransferase RgtA/B/C/D-like domain-containing protein n=1 Tax=candidate division WWE3 bacterium RIFCSPHIGHO2_02_FULL_38_14 TaxID=1802620 RepID=A0A1F4V7Z6_UNCKA|nr:MAG: hypothetical protein A2793_02265 [candidate division WWE3 bacterium RIFCSPHIGHO2_01_FULL_38_45]OGC48928.1 MAG: hypothetical protein A3F07_03715 [candidate division WWE3 bacterium RIFCSPHIGHO2_12_FULL_38_15]OGC52965.1 MAG: hypothetical protein A3B64_04890 [candidate division WWE3 bacterium RIFCSPLOWO2_01_FULL_37_24]OGC53234.1 MAG: hypothetical protein A3D91_02310 [candidate division WWE3 bacterium RIFCSPHIGHO2_02_FULL_38_14]
MNVQVFKKRDTIFTLILLFSSFILRMVNLGYSDYQGDEIKALFLPDQGQNISAFLLDQRKGPVQFIVTFFIKFINPDYSNEFLTRLPFALAGIFAVLVFYKFLKLHFKDEVAFFASFFLSTNGFLIAFSRIVQYQSFVILFMLLSLYFFSLALKNDNWRPKGVYFGIISWAVSILSHYDGIFIFPFVFFLFFKLIKTAPNIKKHLLFSFLTFTLLISVFYIPFIFSISQSTLEYWTNRLSGGSEKISSSKYLFTVYHPIYTIHIYTLLAALGFSRFVFEKIRKRILMDETFFILLWLLVTVVFLEIIVNIPGTHIFTYLIPLSFFIGYGIKTIKDLIFWFIKHYVANLVTYFGILIVFSFLFLQSYAVFVDHSNEYPWEGEKFLIWEFPKPTPIFHLSMFGFPYNRNWEEIRDIIISSQNNGYYSTNERESISRYYIPLNKSSEKAGYFVLIRNPQSFNETVTNLRVKTWIDNNLPVFTVSKSGKNIVEIYYIPDNFILTSQI